MKTAQQRRGVRTPSGKHNLRVARKLVAAPSDEPPLSREWIKEIERRLKDSRDPVRYMLANEFTRKFILYYDVTNDEFAMNDPGRGTLFKRRAIAQSVLKHLGRRMTLVRFMVKGGKLKRLSPFRGGWLRHNKKRRRRNSS